MNLLRRVCLAPFRGLAHLRGSAEGEDDKISYMDLVKLQAREASTLPHGVDIDQVDGRVVDER